ncbi:MAG: FG-GAP-like repeat-containing protein [Candidatus Latescibacterota bacterium]
MGIARPALLAGAVWAGLAGVWPAAASVGPPSFHRQMVLNAEKWYTMAAASVGDLDNDGFPDLLLADQWPFGTRREVWRNGQGEYVAASQPLLADTLYAQAYGQRVSLADYDGDADLDVFLPLVGWTYADRVGATNLLLRNNGSAFVDVARAAGLTDSLFTQEGVWLDYDRDGHLDLYVHNVGGVRVEELALETGVTVEPMRLDLGPYPHLGQGRRNRLAARLSFAPFEPSATVTEAVLDLGDVGGPARVPFRAYAPGIWRAEADLVPDAVTGWHRVVCRVRQSTSLGEYWSEAHRLLALAPAEDLVIYGDALAEGWTVAVDQGGQLDLVHADSVAAGRYSLAIRAESGLYLTVETQAPVDTLGYAALRFSLHPGTLQPPARGRPEILAMTNRSQQRLALLGTDRPWHMGWSRRGGAAGGQRRVPVPPAGGEGGGHAQAGGRALAAPPASPSTALARLWPGAGPAVRCAAGPDARGKRAVSGSREEAMRQHVGAARGVDRVFRTAIGAALVVCLAGVPAGARNAFDEVAEALGVADASVCGNAAAWGDYDNDGDLNVLTTVSNDYSTAADGTNQQRLTRNGGLDSGVAWSPDGQRLAYQSDQDHGYGSGLFEIYIRDPDGTERGVTHNLAFDGNPVWSPDGAQIAFGSTRDGGNEKIQVVDADGRNPRRFVGGPTPAQYPEWPAAFHVAAAAVAAEVVRILTVRNQGGTPLHVSRVAADRPLRGRPGPFLRGAGQCPAGGGGVRPVGCGHAVRHLDDGEQRPGRPDSGDGDQRHRCGGQPTAGGHHGCGAEARGHTRQGGRGGQRQRPGR